MCQWPATVRWMSLLTFPEFPTLTLVLLAAAALVAGLARGFSGFGAALVFVPLASALIGPKLASPILVLIDLEHRAFN